MRYWSKETLIKQTYPEMKIVNVSIFILFLTCGCKGLIKSPGSQLREEIQKTVDLTVNKNNLPGLNLSVVFEDGEQINYASGFADIETRTLLDTQHVMFSGSIGKTYAVAVLLQLVEEGKIGLQDKFIDYFPELDWLHRLPNIDEISIEMLLQHSSGLPRYVMKPELWEQVAIDPDKIWTCRDRLEYIFDMPAVHEAGKGWSYSDSNYILLGMLIEKITGSEYYDVAASRILNAAGLHNTFPANSRTIKALPQAYSKLPEMFRMPEKVVENGEYIFNPQMEWTGGGYASTTSDLAQWARIYYKGDLFPDSLLEKVVTPTRVGQMIEPGLSYGMGSFIFDTEHGPAYGHTGFVPGFNSIFAYYPEYKIAMAIQVNCDYSAEKTRLIDYVNEIMGLVLNNPPT